MKIFILSLFVLSTITFSQNQEILKLRNDAVKIEPAKELKELIAQEAPARKKAGIAVIYSLLLPGMGELYAEGYHSGKYFTIAEGALWGIFIGMNSYAGWQQDRYKSFAESNGSVNLSGKDEQYFSDISQFLNIEDYNDQKALERTFEQMYDPSADYWKWQTDADRAKYRSMWLSSEQTYNDLRFVAGALILNRVISAINAVRLVSAYNKRLSEEVTWNFSLGISNEFNRPSSLILNISKSF